MTRIDYLCCSNSEHLFYFYGDGHGADACFGYGEGFDTFGSRIRKGRGAGVLLDGNNYDGCGRGNDKHEVYEFDELLDSYKEEGKYDQDRLLVL